MAVAEPMYRVIADDLRRQIESGELPAGTQLKTEGRAARGVRAAGPAYLPDHGPRCDQATRRPWFGGDPTRPGTFVLGRNDPFVSKLAVDPAAGGLEDKIYSSEVERQGRGTRRDPPASGGAATCPPRLRSHSASRETTRSLSRHQRRSIDGTPYSMQTTYYPMNFVTEKGAARLLEARDIEGGVVDYLRDLGIDQVGWRDRFILRPPDASEQAFFDLSEQGPSGHARSAPDGL